MKHESADVSFQTVDAYNIAVNIPFFFKLNKHTLNQKFILGI